MADLSLLQQDARTAARLTDALAPPHTVQVHTSWAALERRLAGGSVDACVLDADHPTREEAVTRLAALQRRHPATAMVAFGDFRGQERSIYRLGRLGVDGLVASDGGAAGAEIRDAVEEGLLAARARQAAAMLDGRAGPACLRAVAWSVEHARRRPSVEDLARGVGTTPAALAGRLKEARLPTPRRLLVWGRLLLAGALLARDGRTVEEAAYRVGYSGASALARAMRREVGRTPGQIAAGEGLPEVHRALFPGGRARPGAGRLRLILTLALLLVAQACIPLGPGTAGPAPGPGGARVLELVKTPPLDGLHVGILAVDAATGDTVVAHNAHRRFIPASNQKVLTTAAALHHLGPDFRWRTALRSDARVVDGVLQGDLTLVGTGDPSLSDRYWPSAEASLDALADSLRAAGIRRVDGRLLVDASAWDSAGAPGNWEVGDLPWAYGATGGAFAVGEGVLHAVVRGGAQPGEPGTLAEWWPRGVPGYLRAELETVAADSSGRVRAVHLDESRALVLRGTVPAGTTDTLRFAMREPVREAAALLRRALENENIPVTGPTQILRSRDGAVDSTLAAPRREPCPEVAAGCPGGRVLAALESPPLTEIARGILEPSQNWMAEQLLWTLGAARPSTDEDGADRSTPDAGRAALTAYLVDELGLDSLAANPEDGSGLTAQNLLSPHTLVAILDHARRAPWGEAYREALASPGEEDSTLERRLPELEGRLWAKTGTISNVNSLSGYLTREDGTLLLFSLLSNGSGLPSAAVRDALDEIVRTLAEG